MIRESIVTTLDADGRPHIAPIGVHEHVEGYVIAPFRPSGTLDNLIARACAVVNFTDDVRVFAGCVTGRRDWPCLPAERIESVRLAASLAHCEVAIVRVEDDPVRPRIVCRSVHEASHAPFRGFNRAQAAVIEGAILVSRLHLLPLEQIATDMGRLHVAVDKTAGAAEREAWQWLVDWVAQAGAGANGRIGT